MENNDGDLFSKLFGYSVDQPQTERTKVPEVSDMDQIFEKCPCGNKKELRYVSKLGKVGDKLVTVTS